MDRLTDRARNDIEQCRRAVKHQLNSSQLVYMTGNLTQGNVCKYGLVSYIFKVKKSLFFFHGYKINNACYKIKQNAWLHVEI